LPVITPFVDLGRFLTFCYFFSFFLLVCLSKIEDIFFSSYINNCLIQPAGIINGPFSDFFKDGLFQKIKKR